MDANEIIKIINDEWIKEDKRPKEIIYATSQEIIDLWNEALAKFAIEHAENKVFNNSVRPLSVFSTGTVSETF